MHCTHHHRPRTSGLSSELARYPRSDLFLGSRRWFPTAFKNLRLGTVGLPRLGNPIAAGSRDEEMGLHNGRAAGAPVKLDQLASVPGASASTPVNSDVNWLMFLSKAWFFLTAASAVFLFPYLPLYLKETLGMNEAQLGAISALRPWLSSVFTLVLPSLADRFGVHKAMLLLCFIASTIMRCSLWFVGGMLVPSVLLLAADIVGSPIGPLVDSLILANCKDEGAYGRQRVWGSIGFGGLSIVGGWLIQHSGIGGGFLAYGLLAIPCTLVALQFKYPQRASAAKKLGGGSTSNAALDAANAAPAAALSKEALTKRAVAAKVAAQQALQGDVDGVASPPSKQEVAAAAEAAEQLASEAETSFWPGVKKLMRSLPVWVFLLQCFIMGFAGPGMMGTFGFLFVKDMGATTTIMGIILAVNCIVESLVFQFQGTILSVFPPASLLNLAMGGLVLRLLGYASLPLLGINTPWAVLPIELLQGITFAGGWAACCIMSKRLAPAGLEATMQGLVTAMYFGIGAGAGALIGGQLLQAKLGWANTWITSACLVAAVWASSAAAGPLAKWLNRFRPQQELQLAERQAHGGAEQQQQHQQQHARDAQADAHRTAAAAAAAAVGRAAGKEGTGSDGMVPEQPWAAQGVNRSNSGELRRRFATVPVPSNNLLGTSLGSGGMSGMPETALGDVTVNVTTSQWNLQLPKDDGKKQ